MERVPVTSTRHVLNFLALSPSDFERLCLGLIARRPGYYDVEHLGAAGQDRGRDIVAKRVTADGAELVYVQCKRVATPPTKQMFSAEVDKISRSVEEGKTPAPHTVLFAVTQNLSGDLRSKVGELCARAGYRAEFLGVSELDEAMSTHDDLIARFFDHGRRAHSKDAGLPFERVTPRHLGPRRSGFVNRAQELALLDTATAVQVDASRVLVLRGPHGTGKSRLAEEWAHKHKLAYPDGQLVLDFRALRDSPAGSVADALRFSLQALGCPVKKVPERLEDRQGLYRTLTAQRRLMLVLDHVSEPSEVRALLPDSPDAVVLVATNSDMSPLEIDGAVQVSVGTLDVDHARTMLHTIVGAVPQVHEESACEAVLSHCGGLSIALELCATRIRDEGMGSYGWLAEVLIDETTRLARMGGLSDSLDVVFATAYAALPDDLARAYRLVGQAPRLSTWGQVSAALDVDRHAARRLISMLKARHLVEFSEGEGIPAALDIGMHDLLRLHARKAGLAAPDESTGLVHRIAHHAAMRARQIDHAISPNRLRVDVSLVGDSGAAVPASSSPLSDGAEASRAFVIERAFILAAQVAADDARDDAAVCVISDSLWPAMSGRGYNLEIASVFQLAVAASERMGELRNLCRFRMLLARGLAYRGEHGEAMQQCQLAIEFARQEGDGWLLASALEVRGLLLLETSGPEAALPAFEESRSRFPSGSARGRAIQDLHIGMCMDRLDRRREAVEAYAQAWDAFLGLEDRTQAARAGWRLADALLALGRRDEAFAAAITAEQMAMRSGEYLAQGRAMLVLAELSSELDVRRSQLRAAVDAFTEASDDALTAFAADLLKEIDGLADES